MSLSDSLPGALVLAPMTKGSNLPYRRLCVELGARVLMSEMVVARRLKQRRRGELALVRRASSTVSGGRMPAIRRAITIPVTEKIRLGWNAAHRNYLDVARAAVDAGASALTVHGRTREARYRHPADWDAIAEVVGAVSVPVSYTHSEPTRH